MVKIGNNRKENENGEKGLEQGIIGEGMRIGRKDLYRE